MAIRKVSGSTAINRGVNAAVGTLPNMAGVINSVTIGTVTVTDASYNALDDTAVSSSGGFLKITGTGFKPGCTVYIGGSPAASTTYVSPTEVRATTSVLASNTYLIYVLNTDNTIGIKLNALVVSGTPSWNTGATLGGQIDGVAFSIQLSATSDSSITYSLAAGSSVPAGTTLHSNGLFTGTVGGLSSEVTYSFSVNAIDAELQDVARTFSVTVSVGDPLFHLTPLLLNGEVSTWITDASSGNRFANVVGDSRVTALSPYNTNWSAFFDGSNDDVRVTGNNNLAFGTGDFTIEMFFNSGVIGGSGQASFLYDSRGSSNPEIVPIIAISTGNILSFGTGAVNIITATIALNRWYHLVVSRVSGSTRMFLDGVQQGTANTDTNNYLNNTSRPCIGTQGYGDPFFTYQGYISNLRVIKGSGVTSVTVPTAPLTAIANTQLLLFNENRIRDTSTNGFALTRFADPPSVRSFGPFADTDTTTGSGYFDGTGDYLTIPANTAFAFGTGDFTVEAFIYPTAIPTGAAGQIIAAHDWTGGSINFALRVNATTGALAFYDSNTSFAGVVSASAVPLNSWSHVAAVKSSGTITVYQNGVSIGSAASAASIPSTVPISIGHSATGGSFGAFTGYISNARITKGAALYTTAFTPPTSPLTADANTSLLTLQSRVGHNNSVFVDDSGRKNLVARTGNTPQGTFTPFSSDDLYWSQSYANTSYRSHTTMSTGIIDFKSTATFTVEGWINLTAVGATGHIMLATTDFGSTVNWYIGVDPTSRKMVVYWFTGSVVTCLGSTVLDYGRWYFLQFRANNGALSMGLNGVQETLTGTTTLGSPGNSTFLSLGLERTFAGPCMLYDVRVSNVVRAFNLPTTPMSSDASTTLLTARRRSIKDDSSLNTTFLTSGLTQPYTPFGRGTRAVYSRNTHGGSIYFDGSGDRLNTTFSPALTFATLDHTIEFWMYPNGAQGNYGVVWRYSSASTLQATNDYYFSVNGVGPAITFLLGGSGSWAVNITLSAADYNAVLNNWTHVVITRSGSAFRLFFNGVLKGHATSAQSIAAQGSSFVIGEDGGSNSFKGYISDFSVKLGSVPTAYQTASTTAGTVVFTPPTAPVPVAGADIMHYNFNNAGVYDASGRTVVETSANIARLGNVSRYGTGSLYFSGSYQWMFLGLGTPPLLPTLGDFTAEVWIYPTAADGCIFCLNTAPSAFAAVRLGLGASGVLGLLSSTNGSTHGINASSGNVYTLNAWNHIAVVRNGGNIIVYCNGNAAITSTAVAATTALMAGNESVLGAIDFRNNADFISFFQGYMDDFRVTHTARYTQNFTPPTATFFAR
jgi:hypothetical protein